MKKSLITLAVISFIGFTGIATAGPMTLTTDGHLYKVWVGEESLVLSHTAPGMDLEESLIPQSAFASFESVHILVNEAFDTPFIIWTDEAEELSTVRLAALVDGTWFGPVTLAGDDGIAADSPAIYLDTVTDIIEPENEGEEPRELTTTFLHTVWWSYDQAYDLGYGVYAQIPLDESGFPMIEAVQTTPVHELMPFGVGCSASENSSGLARPQFFTGNDGLPLLFTTDFGACVFHILGIDYQVLDELDPYTGLKRRRHISVFRTDPENMAIPPGVGLIDSKMVLGHDHTVLIYWDVEEGIDWLLSRTDGWTEVTHLGTGPDLTHEQAVDLLKNLVP